MAFSNAIEHYREITLTSGFFYLLQWATILICFLLSLCIHRKTVKWLNDCPGTKLSEEVASPCALSKVNHNDLTAVFRKPRQHLLLRVVRVPASAYVSNHQWYLAFIRVTPMHCTSLCIMLDAIVHSDQGWCCHKTSIILCTFGARTPGYS